MEMMRSSIISAEDNAEHAHDDSGCCQKHLWNKFQHGEAVKQIAVEKMDKNIGY